MKKTGIQYFLVIASVLLAPTLVYSATFERVRAEQVPSGMAYSISMPPIESPTLFSGKRIAILASHGVEESEITFPYTYLRQRGAQVDILVPDWTAPGVTAVRFLKPTLWVRASGTFAQATTAEYDLLVLTGGAWNAQVVRTDENALKLIAAHRHAGRPIAAICAGTAILINAGIAQGRRLTGSPTVAIDLKNAGAQYVDQPVVLSKGLVTSRSPNDLPYFVVGVRKLLIGR